MSATVGDGERSRVGWVDVAKGICIIFVVMMHSTLGLEKETGQATWMGTIVEFARPFRMPDFFLISGLFLSAVVDRPWRRFLDRRVLHFAYFYLVWLTIQFVIRAPSMIAEDGVGGLAVRYAVAVFVEPFGTLWFIWMLPVFALVVRLTRNVPVPAMLLAAAGLEALHVETGWVALNEFTARFVYFYVGYAFAPPIFDLGRRMAGNRAGGLALLGIWAVVNGTIVWQGGSHLPGVSLALGLAGALAIVSAAALLDGAGAAGRGLAWLGARSLVVYLSFFLPMVAVRALLLRTGLVPDGGTVALVTTIVSVLVPFAILWAANRAGARFLFERPRWARLSLDRAQPSMKVSTASA